MKFNSLRSGIAKFNLLRVFDTERYKFSYIVGIMFIVGGVFIAKEFEPHPTTIFAESLGFALHAFGMLPFVDLLVNNRPTKTKEVIKFHRYGYIIAKNSSPNQCTLEGWRGYRYNVHIIAGKRLDENGFLIDHNKVHAYICEFAEKEPMESCELVLQKLCYRVGAQIMAAGVELKQLGIDICPVDADKLIVGEDGELKPKDNNDTQLMQAMPAGAEYWCEFNVKATA